MDINVVSTVPYPIDLVFGAMRDQLPDLAEFMPNIDKIEIEKCEETSPGVIELLNKWHTARSEIPSMARPFIDQSKMYWYDHATWIEAEKLCRWRLEVGFMADRVDCKGQTTYHAVDGKTEMRIKGVMNLDLKGLVPRLMINKATSALEAFVGRQLEPNFQKTAAALTAYLDAQSKA